MAIPKPIIIIPHDTKIPFVSYFRVCFTASAILLLATIVSLATVGLNLGIDFRGGTLVEARAKDGTADVGALRTTVNSLGLVGDAQIQGFGNPRDVLIRVAEQPGGDKAQQEALAKIEKAIAGTMDVVRKEVVGGTVSRELLQQALLALALACLGIFTYIWFRFEWQFALGAIVALVHDVLLTIGVFSFFQFDFDLTIVAALLTILGYSVNDTVVIYDRIRENLRKYKKMPLPDLLNLSVNETLARTLMTVGTTFLALLALYIFGGPVIRGFTFAMLFGVLVGTYSSIFIAAPFLVMIGVKRDWSGVETVGRSKVNA